MSYLSLSTWSLHRLLGPLRWNVWNEELNQIETIEEEQPQLLTLLDLPAEAARRGYKAIEICHLHFPTIERSYLLQLREAFSQAKVLLDTLLLDYGDLTSKNETRRAADQERMHQWIDAAAACGARQIRIIAGEASSQDEDALRQSAAILGELYDYGEQLGVRVVTENFKPLTETGANCLRIREVADKPIPLIADFGNFHGSSKYEDLTLILPYSVSVHAKAHYDENGWPDEAEFLRCMDTTRTMGFDGAYVLIYDGPGDMWQGLDRVRQLVNPYLAGNSKSL